MNIHSHIMAVVRFSVREFTGRPKFRLNSFLALLWLPLALLFSSVLWSGLNDESIALRWICWALVSVEPVLIALAVIFRFTEQSRSIVERHVR